MGKGYFVISLDFELIYGILDYIFNHEELHENLFGARKAIPQMLALFKEHSVAVTWAVVGMLFNEDKSELLENLPSEKPQYTNKNVSVYSYLDRICNENNELFFAKDLISMIANCPNQEIATHTYSHYYCTEPGQTINQFETDIQQAANVMLNSGYELPRSIVFPRNMCNSSYLSILKKHGIQAYRGNTAVWYDKMKEGRIKKAIRLSDAYLNIGGNECYDIVRGEIINIPASRFLYPFGKIPHLDWLKLHRIKKQMKYAAVHKKVFHLWWHPHNFGVNTEKNLQSLEKILTFYDNLHQKYGMESVNMKMLVEKVCE